MSYIKAYDYQSYGDLPQPKACGGCGPSLPPNNYIGSYVSPKYLQRPCMPTFCTNMPGNHPAYSSYEKKAYKPDMYSQEYMARGIDSNQLVDAAAACDAGGCDGFDDIYNDVGDVGRINGINPQRKKNIPDIVRRIDPEIITPYLLNPFTPAITNVNLLEVPLYAR